MGWNKEQHNQKGSTSKLQSILKAPKHKVRSNTYRGGSTNVRNDDILPTADNVTSRIINQRSGKVKWDEVGIAEDDKLRGTRAKILEPNTPYYNPQYSAELADTLEPLILDPTEVLLDGEKDKVELSTSFGNQGVVSPDELRQRLEILKTRADQNESDDDSENLEASQRNHRALFEQRRRAHYNEYLVLKKMRSSGSFDDDDDDDNKKQ